MPTPYPMILQKKRLPLQILQNTGAFYEKIAMAFSSFRKTTKNIWYFAS